MGNHPSFSKAEIFPSLRRRGATKIKIIDFIFLSSFLFEGKVAARSADGRVNTSVFEIFFNFP